MPAVRANDGTRFIVEVPRAPELFSFEDAKGRPSRDAIAVRNHEREHVLIAIKTSGKPWGKNWDGEIYKFAPRKIARSLVENQRAKVIPLSHEDYEHYALLAQGYNPDDLRPIMQTTGQILDPDVAAPSKKKLLEDLQKAYLTKKSQRKNRPA